MAEADVRAALRVIQRAVEFYMKEAIYPNPDAANALAAITAALDAGARETAAALRKYGADHIEDGCAKWAAREFAGVTHWEWLKDEPCTCGLDALLLPPAVPERGEGPGA